MARTEGILETSKGAWPCRHPDCWCVASRAGREGNSVQSTPANVRQCLSTCLGLGFHTYGMGIRATQAPAELWCPGSCTPFLSRVRVGPSRAKGKEQGLCHGIGQAGDEGPLLEKSVPKFSCLAHTREGGGEGNRRGAGRGEAWTQSARVESRLCPDLPCAYGQGSIPSSMGRVSRYRRERSEGWAPRRRPARTRRLVQCVALLATRPAQHRFRVTGPACALLQA